MLVFERRSERSVHPKRTATIVQNGLSEQRLAKNHDCRSERQMFEQHTERHLNGRSAWLFLQGHINSHFCFGVNRKDTWINLI